MSLLNILFLGNSMLNAQQFSKDSLLLQINAIRDKGGEGTQNIAYVDLLNELATKYRFRNADSLKILADEALELSTKISYDQGKAYAILRRGDYNSDIGLELDAFAEYKKSKKLAFSLNYPRLKVEVLKSIATQNLLSQNLEEAILNFYAAIEMASQQNFNELEARLRHNLGYYYFSYKLYDEAQIEYLIADSLWVVLKGENHQKAKTMSNIALNAIDKGDLELASCYNDKSITILTGLQEHLWLSRAYRTKSRYFIKTQEFQEALKWVKKSDSILNYIYYPRDKMEVDSIHSTIFLELGKVNIARKYLKKNLEAASSLKDSLFILQSYKNLEKVEEMAGNTEKAYMYHKKSRGLKELLNEKDKVRNVVLLKAKLNFEKEKEILRIKNLKNTLTQQKHFQLITAALLTTIIIALVVYKSNRREKQLNKKLEEKTKTLSENQITLNKINKNQDKLFSIVGHDLRGPIVSLRELVDFTLESTSGKEYFSRFAPKLKLDLDHIHFTLDNLLNWGQSQMKGASIKSESIKIKEEFISISQFCEKTLAKKNVELKKELSNDLKVTCDRNHFNIIFRNLICNAIKFTHNNGTVRVNAEKKEDHIIISVKDNGIGMSKEVLNKVFNSTEHFSTFGTNNERGTGLGLKLCKEMVEKNRGTIYTESSINLGTTIYVLLPSFKT